MLCKIVQKNVITLEINNNFKISLSYSTNYASCLLPSPPPPAPGCVRTDFTFLFGMVKALKRVALPWAHSSPGKTCLLLWCRSVWGAWLSTEKIPNFNLDLYSCCLTSACVPGLPARHSSLVLSTCGFWIISFSSYFLSLLYLWQPCCCFLLVWILTGSARGFAIV